jgi:serine protease AprX
LGFISLIDLSIVTKPTEHQQMVTILLHEDADLSIEHVKEYIAKLPTATVHSTCPTALYATIDKSHLPGLAALDSVYSIQPKYPIAPHNYWGRKIMGLSPPAEREGINDRYGGSKQIITVADSGFDLGTKEDPHPAFTRRVVELIPVGRPKTETSPGLADDPNSHGTHVAGCALGAATSATMRECLGTAPLAELIVMSLWDGTNFIPNFPDTLLQEAIARNSYIFNMSYGASMYKDGPYDADAKLIDDFIFVNPEFNVIMSAGNQGENKATATSMCIGGQSLAKNAITVGSCQSTRRLQNDHNFSLDDALKGHEAVVSLFSSIGNPNWPLIKPDLVAPGYAILSAATRNAEYQKAFEPKLDGQDTPYRKLDKYAYTKDDLYCFKNGTSMSAPLVAGGVAVLRDAFIDVRNASPNSAMIRALLAHGAVAEKLYQGNAVSAPPNRIQGFGRANISRSLLCLKSCEQGVLTKTPSVPIPCVTDKAGTLHVTLAFVDRAGPEGVLQSKLGICVQLTNPTTKEKSAVYTGPTDQVTSRLDVQIEANMTAAIWVDGTIESAKAKVAPYGLVWSVETVE